FLCYKSCSALSFHRAMSNLSFFPFFLSLPHLQDIFSSPACVIASTHTHTHTPQLTHTHTHTHINTHTHHFFCSHTHTCLSHSPSLITPTHSLTLTNHQSWRVMSWLRGWSSASHRHTT